MPRTNEFREVLAVTIEERPSVVLVSEPERWYPVQDTIFTLPGRNRVTDLESVLDEEEEDDEEGEGDEAETVWACSGHAIVSTMGPMLGRVSLTVRM